MIIKTFTSGFLSVNNYLLIDEKSKEAVLIDCSENNLEIKNELKKHDATLKYVLMTHGHFDHVLGINETKKHFPETKFFIHENDDYLLLEIDDFMRTFGVGTAEPQHVDEFIKDNDELFFGSGKIKVIHTAGHTPGGVCYIIEDKIFSGDTIFFESIGRTDLPRGDFKTLQSSIKDKIFTLQGDYTIYPGHGQYTTLEHEKQFNPII